MKRFIGASLLGAIAAGAPAEMANPPSSPAQEGDFGPGQYPYGAQGSLTADQLAYLKGLGWPQSYGDIKNTFGFPTHRTAGADYYRLEDTNIWVVVEYSGPEATGYRTE